MKALLDIGETQYQSLGNDALPYVAGQLLTPLTRYTRWSEHFAIDNGAYTRFDRAAFDALLEREHDHVKQCLFVAVPDVVGDGRRTLEVFFNRHQLLSPRWPLAFVCQDGSEDHAIPWDSIVAVFIGGTTEWKMSQYAAAIIKAAKILGKHTHVGRINTAERWNHFEKLGVDTCDGSGLSRFSREKFLELTRRNHHPLLEATA